MSSFDDCFGFDPSEPAEPGSGAEDLGILLRLGRREVSAWGLWDRDEVEPGDDPAAIIPEVQGYDLGGRLGEGGMGTVWRAIQLSTGRAVALKLLRASALGSVRARARFEREVELTAASEHPHVARVYDSGLRHGFYFYAMELVEGLP